MNTTALKVVIDTNIFIAVIGRKSPFRWIFEAIINGGLIICVTNEILTEYREVFERKTTREVAENVTDFLIINPFTEKVDVYFNFNLIPQDEDDNKFVDCAIASNAICLVSNDTHFQILKTIDFPKVQILTLSEFASKYKNLLTEK